jgi:HEAT repeat protein
VNSQRLIIINPTGETTHQEFYDQLKTIKEKYSLEIALSTTAIQHHEKPLSSCGPLCVELMRHFMNINIQELHEFIRDTGKPAVKQGLRYQSFSMANSSYLPESLLGLDEEKNEDYRQHVLNIRQIHLDTLREIYPTLSGQERQQRLEESLNTPQENIVKRFMFKELLPLQLEEDPNYIKLKNALLKRKDCLLDRGDLTKRKSSRFNPAILGRADRVNVMSYLDHATRREAAVRQEESEVEYRSSLVSLNSSSSSSFVTGYSNRVRLFSNSREEERINNGSQVNGSNREVAPEQAAAFPFSPPVEIRPVEKMERDLSADNVSGHFKHRVFISHRGTRKHDIAFPMMAIFSYFCGPEFAVLDRVSFGLGEENDTVISEKLLESAHCLVVITKDFFQSKWTVEEVDYFLKARKENPDNQKKRKIIPLFIGFSPAQCRSLKRSDCETDGQPVSEEDFQKRRWAAEKLSRLSGREQHERFEASEEFERVKSFILNQMPDLLENHLRDGSEPSLLPDLKPGLLLYIHKKAVSYYQEVNGEVNLMNFLDLITKLRLQTSLRAQYAQYNHLERLFDERKTPIVDSFINLALIKETEYKKREQGLGGGANLEEKDENQKEFIDERISSHEALYAVKEPLELNQLFEPKEDAKTPNKILILGHAGIGKTILCQYLAVQWASKSSECKDEEQREELGNYFRQKFDAVFWIRLREVAAGPHHHNTVAKVISQFCLRGLHKPSLEELDTYLKSYSDKTLFILDGYDEITDVIGESRCTHLTDFLNEIVNYQHILVTSRPLAIDALEQSKITFDRKLENIGFTNENIEAYVRQFMREAEKPDQAETLLNFLKTHPSIWGIAHIPIHLELLSWLWSKEKLIFRQGQSMTLSKLYQTIVDRVQQEYTKKKEKERKELSSSELGSEFLECLAYKAMQQESLLIPEDHIRKVLSETLKKHHQKDTLKNREELLKSATAKLGFLRAIGQGGQSQLDQPHYFIHLSFQEFYAARHITQVLGNPIENEEKIHVIQHIITEKYMPRYQLMLYMTSGLLYQQGIEKGGDFLALEQFWKAILSEPRDLIGFHHFILVMHCLDECEEDNRLSLHKMLIGQQLRWVNFYKYSSELAYFSLSERKHLQRQWIIIQDLKYEKKHINHIKRYALVNSQTTSGEVVNALLTLKDENEDARQDAVYALGNLKNPSGEVVNALLTALKDENKDVRQAAVYALGNLKNPSGEVVNALLTALKDENKDVRQDAVYALGKLQDPSGEVVNALLTALKDENKDVRQAAVYALGNLKNPSGEVVNALLTLKDKNERVKNAAVYALGKLQDPSGEVVNALLTTLKDEDKEVRATAVSALNKLQNPSGETVNVLLTALKDKNERVRNAAVNALGNLKNPSGEVVNALLTTLKDENEDMRYAAVNALGKLQDPSGEVVNALLTVLKDEDENMSNAAFSALDNLQNASGEAVNVLLTALKDENERVRNAAVNALGKLQDPSGEVVNALLTVLKDEDENMSNAAFFALDNLQNSSDEVVNVLLTALKDENEDMRYAAVNALGKLQDPSGEVVNALLTTLKDENEDVRQAAVYALSNLKTPSGEVVNALLTTLKDENEDVRQAAVYALSNLKTPSGEVVNALLTALKDENEDMRQAAVYALSKLQDPSGEVVNALLTALKDENEDMRYAAVNALGKLQDPSGEVVNALLTALKNENDVRKIKPGFYVIRPFPNLRDEMFQALLKALHQNPSNEIVNALLKALKDENDQNVSVREAMVSALGKLKTDHLHIVFERLINHAKSLRLYLSSYFKKHNLLCIDYKKGQVILCLYNKIHKISFSNAILIHLEEQIRVVAEQLQCPLDIINNKGVCISQDQIKEPHWHSKIMESDISKRERVPENQMQYEEEKESETRQKSENEALLYKIQEAPFDDFEIVDLDASTLPAEIDTPNEQKPFDSDSDKKGNYSSNELEKLQIELFELREEREAIQPLRKGARRPKWDNEHAELSTKIDNLEKQIAALSRTRSNSYNSRPSSSGLFSSSSSSSSSSSVTGHPEENNESFPHSPKLGNDSNAVVE